MEETCAECGKSFVARSASMPCPYCGAVVRSVNDEPTMMDPRGASTLKMGVQKTVAKAPDINDEPTLLSGGLEDEPTRMEAFVRPSEVLGHDYVPFSDSLVAHLAPGASTPASSAMIPHTEFFDSRTQQRKASDTIPESATSAPTAPPRPNQLPVDRNRPPTKQPEGPVGRPYNAPDETSGDNPTRAMSQDEMRKGSTALDRAAETVEGASTSHDYSRERPEDVNLVGRNIDGYLVTQKIGSGGMGAVCLARQVSLDRDVALKILPGSLADNPDFLARFTREALSAAQLNHHNVVQVFDVGNQGNVHYISMEYVRGDNLGNMTRKDGKLAVEDAAGYVLQVARGLAFAHENGIIHRDIKPDNIMVNEHGIVKIADLGLAKVQGMVERPAGTDVDGGAAMRRQAVSDLTGANMAMGTPAYMAPEQGRDASKVDHRADQYSLGCTLYYLVAGKTPFTGKTTFEIISKHASEPLVPLDAVVKNVPKELSFVIEKMLAKEPADRYPSMREVVTALEGYLGLESAKGPYTPREHHVAILEKEQKNYYMAPAIKLRKLAVAGFFAVFALGFVIAAIMQSYPVAAGMLGIMLLTPACIFLVDGFMTRGYFFRRIRSVFFGMPLSRWAMTIAGTAITLAVLYFLNLLIPWAAVSILALGFALAYQFLVVRKLRSQRAASIAETHEMFKQLRVRGVSEDAIEDFVYRFSSRDWEEFFEELFGYEQMILLRSKNAKKDKAAPRKKRATWRDPVAKWLDDVQSQRQKKREERQLQRDEKNRLKATGLSEAEAENQASKIAKEVADEGFLKQTLIVASPTKAEAEDVALDLIRSQRAHGKVFWVFKIARLAMALFMIFAALIPILNSQGITALNSFGSMLLPYYRAGVGPSAAWQILPAVAALVLLLTVFSSRVLLPLMITAGCVLAILFVPITHMAGSSQFTPMVAFYAGLVAVAGGFAMMILTKLGGAKF
ncbi:hypothetical protein BH09SUM1_BH09SUM1_32030 [soil metagenome]